MVEFALVFPVFMVMMAASFAGWSAIHDDIGATGAARAAALVASIDVSKCQQASPPCSFAGITATEQADILAAVKAEQNNNAFVWIAWGAPCPSACVTARQISAPTSGIQLEDVRVYVRAATEIPAFPGLLVMSEAVANP
jgi:hypothetical protein